MGKWHVHAYGLTQPAWYALIDKKGVDIYPSDADLVPRPDTANFDFRTESNGGFRERRRSRKKSAFFETF
jgi:hypothetical protein